MKLMIAILILSVSVAQAQKSESNGVHVMPMSPDFPAEKLKKDGYKVHPYERSVLESRKDQIPDPVKRDQIFAKAGIASKVVTWDHLEKDMLYMRALTGTLPELQAKYPKMDKSSLQKLQAMIRQGEGK